MQNRLIFIQPTLFPIPVTSDSGKLWSTAIVRAIHFSNVGPEHSYATPSCGFYYYLVLSILIMLSLVLFTIAAKQYKLRERERHVNIQAIAEEHYERYLDQEEEYMREAANMYK